MWRRFGILAFLALLPGCQAPAEDLSGLVPAAAAARIRPGMTRREVLARMGEPHAGMAANTGGRSTRTDPAGRVVETRERLIYWNRADGRRVVEIDLQNDRVQRTQAKEYPKWMLEGTFGSTQDEVRRSLGKPTHVIPQVLKGEKQTHWVYTDQSASERTMLLTFDPSGRLQATIVGPNRSDWDQGKIR